MKIIYDEAKAEQAKCRYDAKIPEQNRRYKKANIIRTVVFALCELVVLCLVVLSWSTLYRLMSAAGLLLCIVAGLICAGFVYVIYISSTDVIMPVEDYYSPAVKYYCATKDKKLLKTKTMGNPPWQLTLVLEDENHIVTEATINLHFPKKTRADISEIIIDMNEQIVYIPYEEQKGNNSENPLTDKE